MSLRKRIDPLEKVLPQGPATKDMGGLATFGGEAAA